MVIYKNTQNSLSFTGFEKGVLINPYYLFEFIKDDSKTKTYCVGVDVSVNKVKYNLCVIEDKTSPNPLNGEVNLLDGRYLVNIYEQASSTNLDPTGLTKVEDKILRVIGTTAARSTYNDYTNQRSVYNG